MNHITQHPPIPFVSQSSEDEQQHWIDELAKSMPGERIVALTELTSAEREAVEVAIVANPNPEDLSDLPSLRWVHSVWAGVERLLAEMPTAEFSIVRLVDPELATTMADAVLAWTFYLHRDMPAYAALQARRQWQALPYVATHERTVGVLGLGALGHQTVKLLTQIGFKVSGWARQQRQIEGVRCYAGPDGLKEMLVNCQILVCLLPQTEQTVGLLDRHTLSMLPKGASLINFGRGPIVNDADLLAALDSDLLSHAVLDVFAQEPLPAENPYWGHSKVTVIPHMSAPTTPVTASQIVAGNIQRFRATGQVPTGVDRRLGY